MKKSICAALIILIVAVAAAMAADYKAQLEAAFGGTIVAVERTTQYPPSSMTQILNFTVNSGGGRTEVIPVQVIIVKTATGYAVQSLRIAKTSAAMAIQRPTDLPTPTPETSGGGGGGTGTPTRTPSQSDECRKKCFTNPTGGPIDWVKATACYFSCLLGVPNLLK